MYNLFKINLVRARRRTRTCVCFIQSIYIMIAINMYKFTKNEKKNIDERASVYFGRVGDRRFH